MSLLLALWLLIAILRGVLACVIVRIGLDPRRSISSEDRIKHMKHVVKTSQEMVVLFGQNYFNR